MADGRVVFDSPVTFDAALRRVGRPPPGKGSKASRFILFTGCSFTFGHGVLDQETLPNQLAAHAPGFQVYSYAIAGHSPSSQLLRLQSAKLEAEITEHSGIAVYDFIWDHVGRVIGDMSHTANFGERQPYFYLDASGKLVHDGDFVSGRPWLTRFYQVFGRSQFVKLFGINFPPSPRESDLDLFFQLVASVKKELESRLKIERFVFVIYPGERTEVDRILAYLEKYGIDYLDYSGWDLSRLMGVPDRIPMDNHPTAEAYHYWAPFLARDLKLKTP